MTNLSHEAAIDALCGCAATVTVLSYQEAIEGYFKLRGLPIPATPTDPSGEVERVAWPLAECEGAQQNEADGAAEDVA